MDNNTFLKFILLFGMIFLHLIDDFHLQGMFKELKQKIWWENNYPNKKYKNDYIIALFEHAFSWTFCIMIIPAIYNYFTYSELNHDGFMYNLYFIIAFAINWSIHSIIDNLKANKLKINLIQDQLYHLCQIIITWMIFILLR